MLKLYENIKKRRIELNMSQQDLAERVGYKGKSMISQVENGLIDLPQSMILKFADALKCSASDLMGWEDGWEDYTPPEGTRTFVNPHKIHVTDEEEKIILAYRVADDFDQRFVRRILNIDDGEKENSLNA